MSKEKEKTAKTVALTTKSNLEEMSFDQIMELDEKEREKLINEGQKKDQKRLQLISKVGNVKNELTTLKNKYLKSLTDASVDTIGIKIEMKCKEEELKIAQEVYVMLFPETEKNGSMCVIS